MANNGEKLQSPGDECIQASYNANILGLTLGPIDYLTFKPCSWPVYMLKMSLQALCNMNQLPTRHLCACT